MRSRGTFRGRGPGAGAREPTVAADATLLARDATDRPEPGRRGGA